MTIALTRRDALRLLGFGAVAAAAPAVLIEEPRRRIWQVGAQLVAPPTPMFVGYNHAPMTPIDFKPWQPDENAVLSIEIDGEVVAHWDRNGVTKIADGRARFDGDGAFPNSRPVLVTGQSDDSLNGVYDFSSVPKSRAAFTSSGPSPARYRNALSPSDLEREERENARYSTEIDGVVVYDNACQPLTRDRLLAAAAEARAWFERAERQAGAPTGHYADVLKLDRRLVRS